MDGPLQASNLYVGNDILKWLTGQPIISTGANLENNDQQIYYLLNNLVYNSNTTRFACALTPLDVKFVIVRNNAGVTAGTPSFNLTQIHSFLDRQTNMSLVRSFGDLDIYENHDPVREIYGSSVVLSVPSPNGMMDNHILSLMLSAAYHPRTDVIVASDSDYLAVISNLKPMPVNLTYRANDPTKFTFSVKNSTSPFVLVLSESYDPGWVLNINGQRTSPQLQFMANGYANACYVDAKGSLKGTVEYSQQNTVYLGGTMSLISLVVLVSFTLALHLRRKRAGLSPAGRDFAVADRSGNHFSRDFHAPKAATKHYTKSNPMSSSGEIRARSKILQDNLLFLDAATQPSRHRSLPVAGGLTETPMSCSACADVVIPRESHYYC